MFDKIIKLIENAQPDWSDFRVASIIVDKDGNEYSGVNVEYAIPTNDICAERNAIATAFTNGMDRKELREVHILGGKKENPEQEIFVPPCGVCRQAIYEASNGEAKVFLYNFKGEVKEYSIKELLPLPFTGEEI